MKTEEIGTNCAEIILSENETKILFGSFKDIDYKNPTCKYIIHRLLKNHLPKSFFPLDSKSVLIEIKPRGEGLSIVFTKLYDKKSTDVILRLKNIDDLIKATHYLISFSEQIKSSDLYKLKDRYFLHIRPKFKFENLCEFGAVEKDREKIAIICEYGNLICRSNAIQKITESFKAT